MRKNSVDRRMITEFDTKLLYTCRRLNIIRSTEFQFHVSYIYLRYINLMRVQTCNKSAHVMWLISGKFLPFMLVLNSASSQKVFSKSSANRVLSRNGFEA